MHEEYEAGYFDEYSIRYRQRFIFSALFHGLELNGLKVAELACGSGYNSLALLERFPKARVAGFDISSKACLAYAKVTGGEAFELDLTRGYHGTEVFDAAMIISGLHHMVANLDGAFLALAAMIKPGGSLLIAEPSGEFFLEAARKLWYRADKYFDAATEQALRHGDVLARAAPFFTSEFSLHLGGPAYFLVLNSMIFRIPPTLKKYVSAPAMAAERLYNMLPGRRPYPYFIARWRRTQTPAPEE